MVLPINDRSDVEISLVLHPVFIYKIVKKRVTRHVGQIKFCKVKAHFHTKFHVMTVNK